MGKEEKEIKENKSQKGRLKIFFGYSEGVGKTYAMLKAATEVKKRGTDVVIGVIKPEIKSETKELSGEFEYLGNKDKELDLDGVLRRFPGLVVIDEIAHTNIKGARHAKRYQDIEELLNYGINVFTTANVENIESLNDKVMAVTGKNDYERIPDRIFDCADQVELIDIEPEELIKRNGSVNPENFKDVMEKLTALKEIALRRCADRINMLTEISRTGKGKEYFTDEHILVCLSSAPTNSKNIRTAARMAAAFKGRFTALFVETPDFYRMSEDNKKRLNENMHLAEQLGAEIQTAYGDDVPFQIAEFARRSGVSKIVIGRSFAGRRKFWGVPTLTEKLTLLAPNLDIHIIPDTATTNKNLNKRRFFPPIKFTFSDTLKTLLTLVLVTLIGIFFDFHGFTEANIITFYILGVLAVSVITVNPVYGAISSILSVLLFNFFFTEPRYTFLAHDKGYVVTFIVMFAASFVVGSLAVRLKKTAKQSARAAYRTKILFDTTRLLQNADGSEKIVTVTAKQVRRLLDKGVVIYSTCNKGLSEPLVFPVSDGIIEKDLISEKEQNIALWVKNNSKEAGVTTETFSDSICTYYAIKVNDSVYGVIGIAIGKGHEIEAFQKSILFSILGEAALSLENEKNAREKEEAAIMAKNEQLRANLLRSISHDLRTPLTSISGNASNLISNGESMSKEVRNGLYSNIYDDSMWLINLVENLLAVTRLEGENMQLRMSSELLDDVISESIMHINRESSKHKIEVENSPELIFARMDAKLIVQVIINIVDNAIKYTEEGSEIVIQTFKEGGMAHIKISDNGKGIAEKDKEHIFEMFYSGATAVADSRRSLGLGLFLCKSIINAHGGNIEVYDNIPKGTVFEFTLRAAEVNMYE